MLRSHSFESRPAMPSGALRRVVACSVLTLALLEPVTATTDHRTGGEAGFAKAGCNAPISTTPAQVCPNSTGNAATAQAGVSSYAWSITNGSITSASSTQTITYTAGNSGNVGLSVFMTDPGGNSICGNLNVPIVIPAAPTITPSGPTTFCLGGSVTLTSSSGSGNQWYINANPLGGETQPTFVATATGNYTVIASNGQCDSGPSAPVAVTVNAPPPTPTVTPGGPTTFCSGGNVTLTSSNPSGNQWYLNGNPIGAATSQSYVASQNGAYSVVSQMNGCASATSTSTNVTVDPAPNATISAPTIVSTGSSATASVANAGVGAGYAWLIDNGSFAGPANTAGVEFIAGVPGTTTLDVLVTTAMGCEATGSASVPVSATLFGNSFE